MQDLISKYSSSDTKLLQHVDVLHCLQKEKKLKPITIQLSICENCENNCSFCSVSNRPKKSILPIAEIEKCVKTFKKLGAKGIELTGGGNPLLYRHKNSDINDVIDICHSTGLDIGIITNSKKLNIKNFDKINWVRVSLASIDLKDPKYSFENVPQHKLGLSYIINSKTTENTFLEIKKLLKKYQDIKFVRIAGDCSIKGNNVASFQQFQENISKINDGRIFFKLSAIEDDPFNNCCYMGLIKPYIAPSPDSGDYQIYICTSHVLNSRNYDLNYSLGSISKIDEIWTSCNKKFVELNYPYEIKNNKGKNWLNSCKYCYYKSNNILLYNVLENMTDKNFI